jgi:hypothetical protein
MVSTVIPDGPDTGYTAYEIFNKSKRLFQWNLQVAEAENGLKPLEYMRANPPRFCANHDQSDRSA